MTEKEYLKFHEECLKDYLSFWDFPETRKDTGVSEEEAAYGIFQHAGMLYRYTGDEQSVKGLHDQEISETSRMLMSACTYISEIILADSAERILSADALSETQLMQMEDILISRDTLETVLDLCVLIAKPLLDADDAVVRRALARAKCVAAEIDDVLLDRPDVYSIASRAMIGIHNRIKVKEYGNKWWFEEAWTLDRTMDSKEEEELKITAKTLSENSVFDFPNVADFFSQKFSIHEMEHEFTESPLAYAAAGFVGSDSEIRQFPADGHPLITARIDQATGNCILNLGSDDPALNNSIVWLETHGETSPPGHFVIPHPHQIHTESYVARTTLKLKNARADFTPIKPKVFHQATLITSGLGPDEIQKLIASAVHSIEADPDAVRDWSLFLQELCDAGNVRGEEEAVLQEAIERLRNHIP